MKCTECLTEHPPNGWPWQLFDKPVYWSLSDDGALINCHECKQDKQMSEVILTQIPCGHRLVVCKECIDKYWLSVAENKGLFKDELAV